MSTIKTKEKGILEKAAENVLQTGKAKPFNWSTGGISGGLDFWLIKPYLIKTVNVDGEVINKIANNFCLFYWKRIVERKKKIIARGWKY